jgi:hypothetical protein
VRVAGAESIWRLLVPQPAICAWRSPLH